MSNKSMLSKGLPRSWEFMLSLTGLIILLPVFFSCVLLVRLSSSGKILFRQKRVGHKGKTFTLFKFRTMVEANQGLQITADGDMRITPIGKILRKTKLDELPEIYNVLRGDMSFVGPRPEVVDFVDFKNPMWDKILSVRPGITDPVTLQMRNEEAFLAQVEDKEKYYREVIQPYKLSESIKYLESRSLKKDLMIIFQTFKVIILPQTAPQPAIEETQYSLGT